MSTLFAALTWLAAGASAADTGTTSGIELSQESCESGERVEVSLVGLDDTGLMYSWRSEAGEFEDAGALATGYTCPPVDCPGQHISIDVITSDADGNQTWYFSHLVVSCAQADVPKVVTGGCAYGGGQASLVALALIATALAARSRGT